jgi:hypothetical protein
MLSLERLRFRLNEHAALERDDIGMNRHRALGFCLRRIFSKGRFTLFRITV